MDNVFRRAAENYPLNTNGADWSKVAKALHPDGEPLSKQSNKKRYLWFLLLLLVPFVCVHYTNNGTTGEVATTTSNNTTDVSALKKETVATTPSLNQNSQPVTLPNNTEKTPINNPASSKVALTIPILSTTSVTAYSKRTEATAPLYKSAPAKHRSSNERRKTIEDAIVESTGAKVANALFAPLTTTTPKATNATNVTASKLSGVQTTLATQSVAQGDKKPEAKPADSASVASTPSEPSKAPAVTLKPKKHFYAGLVAGGSVTSIKGQKLDKPGYDVGAVVGYKINKRWSVEAAAIYTKKNYYTQSEYYKGPVYPSSYVRLDNVDGSCHMYEVSVLGKYNFKFTKNHNWFVTGGLTSFIMKKEFYMADYYTPATNSHQTYPYTYLNSSKDWFSIAQFSFGYSLSLNHGLAFRVEPYVQVPLKGVGTAKLPLTSVGLRLGITKTLF